MVDEPIVEPEPGVEDSGIGAPNPDESGPNESSEAESDIDEPAADDDCDSAVLFTSGLGAPP